VLIFFIVITSPNVCPDLERIVKSVLIFLVLRPRTQRLRRKEKQTQGSVLHPVRRGFKFEREDVKISRPAPNFRKLQSSQSSGDGNL
jgi:hypothetical protein